MIEYPTPTRAEVADVADVVRQRADALMLSGESAIGAYPDKALGVLRAVATSSEEWCRSGFIAYAYLNHNKSSSTYFVSMIGLSQ